jgi:hypothetical protein
VGITVDFVRFGGIMGVQKLMTKLSPDGGVAGTTSLGHVVGNAPKGVFLIIEISIHLEYVYLVFVYMLTLSFHMSA